MIAGWADGFVYVWDAGTGELRHRIKAHSAVQEDREYLHRVRAGVGSLAVDPHGQWVITAGTGIFDRTLRAWDLATGSEIANFFPAGTQAPPPGAGRIEVSPRHTVYAKFGSEIVVWEVANRVARRVAAIGGDDGRVTSFAIDPLGRYIVTGNSNGTMAIRDSDGHAVVRVAHMREDVSALGEDISALAWSPCGDWIASGATDGLVRVWRIERLR